MKFYGWRQKKRQQQKTSWVEMSLHTKCQLPKLLGGRTTSLTLNSIGGWCQVSSFFLIFLLVGLK